MDHYDNWSFDRRSIIWPEIRRTFVITVPTIGGTVKSTKGLTTDQEKTRYPSARLTKDVGCTGGI